MTDVLDEVDLVTHLITVIIPESPPEVIPFVTGDANNLRTGGVLNTLRLLAEAKPPFTVPLSSSLEDALRGNALSGVSKSSVNAYVLNKDTSRSMNSLFREQTFLPLNAWHLTQAFQADTLAAFLREGARFGVLLSKTGGELITVSGRVGWSTGHSVSLRPDASREKWPKGTVFLLRQ